MFEERRGARYFGFALALLFGAAALHFVSAHLLLSLADRLVETGIPGPRATVHLTVAGTTLLSLAIFYLRAQYSSPDHLTRSVPLVYRLAPPLLTALFVPLTYPSAIVRDPEMLLQFAAPVLSATWAPSFALAVMIKRLLHALAVRTDSVRGGGIFPEFDPPRLAGGYARVLGGAAFAATLMMLGMVVSSAAPWIAQIDMLLHVILPIVGLVVMIAIAAAAGASLGESPGRDVVSIASRLDAVGYNTRYAMDWPVVVTSFDEVGELLVRLDELRGRLSREASLYQEALDKTRVAEAAKSDFLSAVSHELRTPLNSVTGFAQLLLESRTPPLTTAQAEDVRLIRAGGQQLLELINDILDLSMIESGELRLSFAPVDIADVIDEVVRIHQPLVRDRDVLLTCEIGPDLPLVVCDRRRISQILTNLVSNAIKFTEHGLIAARVAFDARSEVVIIRVMDTGVGIAPGDLESVFEEYRQVGSVKRRKKGTGLGLAIARSIALHHGGSLTVESTLGSGSSFTLTLPINPTRRPSAIDVTEEAARAAQRALQRSLDGRAEEATT